MSKIVLRTEHIGIIKLGKNEIPVCVLNNKKRVIIQREFVNLLTGTKKGGLDRYTKANGVRQFMPKKYVDQAHKDVVLKFSIGGSIAYGYEAIDMIEICDAYLMARDSGTLQPTQEHLAVQAEIIIRASAKVGIEALIDEATGYQSVRDAEELQIKFKTYISDELQEWTKTFPKEFFINLFRLEGSEMPVRLKAFPKRFGRYVMRYVYDTLDPDIADWLRKNNPDPAWNQHHHQWLTKEFGYPRLVRHLLAVIGIMKASLTIEEFNSNLARAFPEARTNRLRRIRAKKNKEGLGDSQTEMEFTYI